MTVLMVLGVFLIVMIIMVVALAVAVVLINVTEKLFWGRHVYC
jgi:hypothetical protein